MAGIDNDDRFICVNGFDAEELGRRVRFLRENIMKMSREWLAEQVGLSAGHIANIELAGKGTTPENILLIAQALHTTPNYLLAQSCEHTADPEKACRIARIADILKELDNEKLEHFETIAMLWVRDMK